LQILSISIDFQNDSKLSTTHISTLKLWIALFFASSETMLTIVFCYASDSAQGVGIQIIFVECQDVLTRDQNLLRKHLHEGSQRM
jgi:hypothetical protein